MLSSVARRLVEEARRLLKHHSSARANPGPAATFPTLCHAHLARVPVRAGRGALCSPHEYYSQKLSLFEYMHGVDVLKDHLRAQRECREFGACARNRHRGQSRCVVTSSAVDQSLASSRSAPQNHL